MPLTPEQLKEMKELEELERLHQQFGSPKPVDGTEESLKKLSTIGMPKELSAKVQADPTHLQNLKMGLEVGNSQLGNAVGEQFGKAILKPIGGKASKLADWLQQKAMGMKKFVPDAGTTALREGVYGSKEAMSVKMGKALARKGDELESAVSGIKGDIDSKPIADRIMSMSEDYVTPGGRVSSEAQSYLDKIIDRAAEIEKRGALPAQEQLAMKRIGQRFGYKQGEPLSRLQRQLGQQEALGIGEQLEKTAAAQGNPGTISETNKKLSKLISGDRALTAPEAIRKNPVGLMDLLVAGGGSTVGGLPGAIGGLAAKRAIESPAVQSYAAKGLDVAGQSLTGGSLGKSLQLSPRLAEILSRKAQE